MARSIELLSDVASAPTTGLTVYDSAFPGCKTVQATVSGSGTVSATVIIDVSNDGSNWIANLGTITLSGTTSDTDGFVYDAPWAAIRARLTAVAGSSASVTTILAAEET